MPISYLTRIVEFTATHQIRRTDWPDERNAREFGRAAQDHGHRYQCRVTVKGPLDARAGGVMQLQVLDRLLAEEVTTRLECKRGRISTRSTSVKRDPAGAGGSGRGARDAPRPASPEPRVPGSRRGRMLAESAAVEEMPVWLEVNGEPAVTWMCTPDQLEELATGWLHGEGYIE